MIWIRSSDHYKEKGKNLQLFTHHRIYDGGLISGEHVFTLKEDVDVADKALAAEVRDNIEPWRLRLVSEP